MLVQETYINATEGHTISKGEPFEPFTDDTGKLFRVMQREYGRCISSVYVDSEEGPPMRVGWVFLGRDAYQDEPEATYLREVWITLYERYERVVTVDREYHSLR